MPVSLRQSGVALLHTENGHRSQDQRGTGRPPEKPSPSLAPGHAASPLLPRDGFLASKDQPPLHLPSAREAQNDGYGVLSTGKRGNKHRTRFSLIPGTCWWVESTA